MCGAENFVDGIVVGWIILDDENIAFEGKNLLLGFAEKVLQQLFIVDIKIITHMK